jgi:Ran GTPase-activating protein (RanGAP) involved in mRNA processing and transport
LEDADEEALGNAIGAFVDDFGPDFNEHGDPVEAGELEPKVSKASKSADDSKEDEQPKSDASETETQDETAEASAAS